MSTPDAAHNGYQLWLYYPSVPAAIAVSAAFGILATAHGVFLAKKRTWFCIPLVIGGLLEAAGYGARVVAHYHINATLPYAIQSLFILLAPILFAASVYMYLSRIIFAVHGEEQCIISARWLTKIFVCGDIFCFLVQGSGGGLMSGAKTVSRMHLGEHVILGGLVLQIVIFIFFVVVAAVFHMRMLAHPKPQDGLPWQRLLLGLYTVSILITMRNAVRAIGYGMGPKGYFLAHEWITYVFDAALMVTVLLICLLWYGSGVGSRAKQESIESSAQIEREPKPSY